MSSFPTPFPASTSILSAATLADTVLATYAIGAVLSCRLWSSNVHDVYAVQAEHGHYLLKVYRAGWRSHAAVSYEAELLLHLHAAGVAVAVPIATRAQGLVQTLHAPEGARAAVLYHRAPGTHLSIPFHQDVRECALLGHLLARVHAQSAGFASPHARPALDLGFLLDEPLHSMQPFLTGRPELWTYLCDLAARLRAYVDGARGAGLTWGICHGDVHGGNAFIARDGTLTLFDFDACGPGWQAYDLASFRANTLDNDAGWHAFLSGYRAQQVLADADHVAIPIFVALRQYVLLGLRATFVTNNWSDSWWLEKAPVAFFDEGVGNLRAWDQEQLQG